ncbi:MAG: hypothetical protein AAF288_07230 [Planctomycetota bacterium]
MHKRATTLGEWVRELGASAPLDEVAVALKLPEAAIRQAVRDGRLRVSTFRSGDGRVFQRVRMADYAAFAKRVKAKPVITMEGLGRAFRQMAEQR